MLGKIKADIDDVSQINNRYPVRFVFLPDFKSMRELYKELIKGCVSVDISDLITSDDGWITPTKIKHNIDTRFDTVKENTKNLLVVPLSEIARFYNDKDFLNIFLSLSQIEFTPNPNKKRIYIPLVGLWERFEKEFKPYLRKEWGPIWRLDEQGNRYQITVVLDPQEFKFSKEKNSDKDFVENVKEWLQYWRLEPRNTHQELICQSSRIAQYYSNSKPDTCFRYETIGSVKELLSMSKGLNLPFEPEEHEKDLWSELLERINDMDQEIKSFPNLIQALFNIQTFSIKDFIKQYIESSEVERWILTKYLLHHKNIEDGYVRYVLCNLQLYSMNELESSLWLTIFDYDEIYEHTLQERRNMLLDFYSQSGLSYVDIIDNLEKNLAIYFGRQELTKDKMLILTGITELERALTLQLTKEAIDLNEIERGDLLSIYSKTYPDLYDYLNPVDADNLESENAWIHDYFIEYRWSKVSDLKTQKITDIINEMNNNEDTFGKWYYPISSTFSQLNSDNGELIWIDGVGFEWFNLLYHNLVRSYDIRVLSLAKANLPSTTEVNRFKNAEYIRDLDKYIHDNLFKFPEGVMTEIEVVKKLCDKIIFSGQNATIVSDHGFTYLGMKKHGGIKQYDFSSVEHEGRCKWTDTKVVSDSDYICIRAPDHMKKKGKYALVALKHNSLDKLPVRECHGGATPEEVLVPFIKITTKSSKKIQYSIKPSKIEITESKRHYEGISIDPMPPNRVELIGKQNIKVKMRYHDEDNSWSVDFPVLSPGSYKFKVSLDSIKIGEINVTVKGGMVMEDLL